MGEVGWGDGGRVMLEERRRVSEWGFFVYVEGRAPCLFGERQRQASLSSTRDKRSVQSVGIMLLNPFPRNASMMPSLRPLSLPSDPVPSLRKQQRTPTHLLPYRVPCPSQLAGSPQSSPALARYRRPLTEYYFNTSLLRWVGRVFVGGFLVTRPQLNETT